MDEISRRDGVHGRYRRIVKSNACVSTFGDAWPDETSATLGTLQPGQLMVIARSTAAQYKRKKKRIAEIARELAVDYVLEGSLMRECVSRAETLPSALPNTSSRA